MFKKLGLFAIVMVLLFGMILAACSSDSTKGSGDQGGNSGDQGKEELSGEITVWAHPFVGKEAKDKADAMWDTILSSYEEKFPGVKVNFRLIPWDNRDQKILTALAANNGPDVFYLIPDQMPQYAEKGLIEPLDPYLKDVNMDDFVDSSLLSTTWEGKNFGLPILQEAYTYFYNLDIIKKIGKDPENLPTTWEEFEEWAKAAKEKGYFVQNYAGGGSMNGTLYPFLWQAGGEVIKDGEVLINEPNAVDAFKFINKMYEKGWIPKNSIGAKPSKQNAFWRGGKTLSVLGSGITLSNLKSRGNIDFVIGPPLKNKEKVTYGTTGMFVVAKNSDMKKAAAEFVIHITGTESQKEFNTVTQYIPTRKSAKGIFDDKKYLSELASYTQYARPGVIHPAGRTIMPLIRAEVQAMMQGKQTPEEAADAAAEAIQQEIQ